jgi:hypothetical protein
METGNIMYAIEKYRKNQEISVVHLVEGIMSERQYRRLLTGDQSLSLNRLEQLTNRLGLNLNNVLTEIYGNN